MVATKLCDYQHWLVASPDYIEANGEPHSLIELEQHQCLTTLHQRDWPVNESPIAVNGWFATNDNRLLRSCALAGDGIVRIASYFVEKDIQQGRLVRVLSTQTSASFNSIYMVYPQLIYPPAKLKAFVEFVKQQL